VSAPRQAQVHAVGETAVAVDRVAETGARLACPVCGSSGGRAFLSVDDVPVFSNLLAADRAAALAGPRGRIVLTVCPSCTFVWNAAFREEIAAYVPGYSAAREQSTHFSEYLEHVASLLVDGRGVRGRDVLEVGCGQGDFLRLVWERGANRCVGYDPSYAGDTEPGPGLRLVARAYGQRQARRREADCVCCRHTLEHVAAPGALVDLMCESLRPGPDALVFIEVPDIEWILANDFVCGLTYEHCSWFSPLSMARMLESCGLDVVGLRRAFGGEYLWVDAAPRGAGGNRLSAPVANRLADLPAQADRFGRAYRRKTDDLRKMLTALTASGRRVVLWGAAGKGVALLNAAGMGHEQIPYVIDMNPRKHGHFIPGTGQEVVAPEAMVSYAPDVVLVTNPLYLDEMRDTFRDLSLSAEFIVID